MEGEKTVSKIKAFVIMPELEKFQKETEGRDVSKTAFAQAYLSSAEFTKDSLQSICRNIKFHIGTNVDKDFLAKEIANQCTDLSTCEQIIRQLIIMPKKWGGVWLAQPRTYKICENASALVTSIGTHDWYGPIKLKSDDADVW